MLVRWLLTVLGETYRAWAMAAVRRPEASRSSTSRSRVVSSGKGSGAGWASGGWWGAPAEKYASTRLATPGPKTSWPATTPRTALTISSWLAPLSR